MVGGLVEEFRNSRNKSSLILAHNVTGSVLKYMTVK